MQKTRIMLYVNDIASNVSFWQENFGLSIENQTQLPDGSLNVVLTLNPGTELSFFSREFIAQTSPEVLSNQPSLLILSDQFDRLHEQIASAQPISVINGQATFAFTDPEGHYFAVGKSE